MEMVIKNVNINKLYTYILYIYITGAILEQNIIFYWN